MIHRSGLVYNFDIIFAKQFVIYDNIKFISALV